MKIDKEASKKLGITVMRTGKQKEEPKEEKKASKKSIRDESAPEAESKPEFMRDE